MSLFCLGRGAIPRIVGREQYLRQTIRTSLKATFTTITNHDPSLFRYTSGRWMFNEKQRMEDRYIPFDVGELQNAAEASSAGVHGQVTSIKKLAEGGFNRVLLITMQDGYEVLAKIPFHIARPKYYATASEAATMAFLRQKGIPAPEVFSYRAEAQNPVGTEYLLMERVPGISMASRWHDLQDVEAKRLGHTFTAQEAILFETPFPAIGSLYFRRDLKAHQYVPLHGYDERFCIGPIADYTFWDAKADSLNLDRGPWSATQQYLEAIGRKEIARTEHYGKPIDVKFPHTALDLDTQQPGDFVKSLNDYLKLIPHVLPKDHKHAFHRPILRHPDLTPNNIFLDETGRLSSLIDWQHTVVQPLYLAAGYPAAFANYDPELPKELVQPTLREDISSLPTYEQEQERLRHIRRVTFYHYYIFNGARNKAHYSALCDPLLQLTHTLVDYAGRHWTGNNMTLKAAVMRMTQLWKHLPNVEGIECPVHFTDDEQQRFTELETQWTQMNIVAEHFRSRIGDMREDGWVRNEGFEYAKLELQKLKEEWFEACEGDAEEEKLLLERWPYQDHDEHE